MGYFSTITGFVTVFMMVFVGGNVIRRKGWGFAAQVTPRPFNYRDCVLLFVVFKQD